MRTVTQQLMEFIRSPNQGISPFRFHLPIAQPRLTPDARPTQAPSGPVTSHRSIPQVLRPANHTISMPNAQICPARGTDACIEESSNKPSKSAIYQNRKFQPLRTPKTEENHTKKQPSWPTVAARQSLQMVDSHRQERLQAAKQSLANSGFAPVRQKTIRTDPTAVYFGGIPRGQKGVFRSHLVSGHAVPRWALLSVWFFGDNIAEILTHRPLFDRLIASMHLLGYRHLRTFDPITGTLGRGQSSPDITTKPLPTAIECASRCTREMHTTRSPAAKEWYESKLNNLIQSHLTIPRLITSLSSLKQTIPKTVEAP